MGQKMTWNEIKTAFPNEWVAVVGYVSHDDGEVDGEVLYHSKDKNVFYHELEILVNKYSDVAMEYTGERIKNPEIPLLWQISHAE